MWIFPCFLSPYRDALVSKDTAIILVTNRKVRTCLLFNPKLSKSSNTLRKKPDLPDLTSEAQHYLKVCTQVAGDVSFLGSELSHLNSRTILQII